MREQASMEREVCRKRQISMNSRIDIGTNLEVERKCMKKFMVYPAWKTRFSLS